MLPSALALDGKIIRDCIGTVTLAEHEDGSPVALAIMDQKEGTPVLRRECRRFTTGEPACVGWQSRRRRWPPNRSFSTASILPTTSWPGTRVGESYWKSVAPLGTGSLSQ
jgi:hypothetical protein